MITPKYNQGACKFIIPVNFLYTVRLKRISTLCTRYISTSLTWDQFFSNFIFLKFSV